MSSTHSPSSRIPRTLISDGPKADASPRWEHPSSRPWGSRGAGGTLPHCLRQNLKSRHYSTRKFLNAQKGSTNPLNIGALWFSQSWNIWFFLCLYQSLSLTNPPHKHFIYMYIYVHTHIYAHIMFGIYMCVHMHLCTRMYICHMYIHMCICAHIYSKILMFPKWKPSWNLDLFTVYCLGL